MKRHFFGRNFSCGGQVLASGGDIAVTMDRARGMVKTFITNANFRQQFGIDLSVP
jgi:hypothetical protein